MENVAVISLGCDKNRVDTERMLYRISNGGYGISDLNDADIIIVNTCAFIESARQESIDAILSCAELKKSGKAKKLIVTGCMPQKYRDELIKELPEVDAFLGAFEYDGIVNALKGVKDECACSADEYEKFCADENVKRLLTTYPHTAYLKIADGCDNKCTYCTIPSIRGKYRSRPIADVVAEAEGLLKDGVKELVLVAQDVTRFGADRGSYELIPLLKELEKAYKAHVKEPCGFGIRLLYCYPERITDELIDILSQKDGSVFCPYIDIPVQHCSDEILKLMNRRTKRADLEALINKLHSRGITVRTTFMTGFPGESEERFNELVDFVKRVKPDYAGVFAYSKEADTPSAKLPNQVKKSDKLKRVNALGKAISEVIKDNNRKNVGKIYTVLYEDADYDRGLFVGRHAGQAPEVDGKVFFKSSVPVNVGGYYKVVIDGYDEYDLYGRVVAEDQDKIESKLEDNNSNEYTE